MIYLDNNATTRMAADVVQAMAPFWREQYGNASSQHHMGQAARHAVDGAREQVAGLVGARSREIVFTSGGTEANNLAIQGTLSAYPKKRRIVTTAVEHPAVHRLCQRLETQGYDVTYVSVNSAGHLDLDAFRHALDDETALASVMHANNETGVIFPIREISEITAARSVPLHVDTVHTLGKLDLDVAALGANMLSFSAHKMHGPKGVGGLYVRRGTRLRSPFAGGHQEFDLRPGTENVAAIVGFGAAAELAGKRLEKDGPSAIAAMRNRLESGILERISIAHVIGDCMRRTVNTTCIGFERLEAEALLIALSEAGLCASSGSACSSGSLEPSHVLKAMSIDEHVAHGAVRFSLSHETTEEEVDQALEMIPRMVTRLSSVGMRSSQD